jgi:hypothetical protein
MRSTGTSLITCHIYSVRVRVCNKPIPCTRPKSTCTQAVANDGEGRMVLQCCGGHMRRTGGRYLSERETSTSCTSVICLGAGIAWTTGVKDMGTACTVCIKGGPTATIFPTVDIPLVTPGSCVRVRVQTCVTRGVVSLCMHANISWKVRLRGLTVLDAELGVAVSSAHLRANGPGRSATFGTASLGTSATSAKGKVLKSRPACGYAPAPSLCTRTLTLCAQAHGRANAHSPHACARPGATR